MGRVSTFGRIAIKIALQDRFDGNIENKNVVEVKIPNECLDIASRFLEGCANSSIYTPLIHKDVLQLVGNDGVLMLKLDGCHDLESIHLLPAELYVLQAGGKLFIDVEAEKHYVFLDDMWYQLPFYPVPQVNINNANALIGAVVNEDPQIETHLKALRVSATSGDNLVNLLTNAMSGVQMCGIAKAVNIKRALKVFETQMGKFFIAA